MRAQTPAMDSKQIRFMNLLALIREAGSKAELSRRTGVNEVYLSQLVKRGGARSKRGVGEEAARKLERGMGKDRGWLDSVHNGDDNGNTEAVHSLLYRVPEISWVQAGAFSGVEDVAAHYQDHPVVITDAQVGQGSFALRVRGDSMTGPPGSRSYPDGCRIIVDPTLTPKPGMRVIVRLEGVPEATFKELAADAGRYFLRPLNPQYPIMPMPEDAQIIGVVVRTIIDE